MTMTTSGKKTAIKKVSRPPKPPVPAKRRAPSGGRRTTAAKTLLAVTTGEPGGIGPEITARLFAGFRPRRSTALVIGSIAVLGPWFDRFGTDVSEINPGARRPTLEDLAAAVYSESVVGDPKRLGRVLFLDTARRERYPVGRDSRGGGCHAGFALEIACRLGMEELIGGIVTAPISKKSMRLAGYHFAGHTEMLAKRFNSPDCQMVMTYRHFRVLPLTRHVALKKVSRVVTGERIVTAIRVLHKALTEQFGVPQPTIGVAGLNPHAGDAGVIGREEIETIRPALARARRMGFRVEGPVPGDALFQHASSGTFDAFISMYHDQGLIPFKMMSKRRGVNVTVGLPVVRTSVDHGVAYDIAGKGVARIESLKEAYRLAEKLSGNGRKTMK
jgi:4-hydroxythreonine-4-phosphate dehydrogenase